MAYEATGDAEQFGRFLAQHAYCRKNFFDPKNGEWYERLHRDGSVKVADKGTKWKCAFHLVRALVHAYEALDRVAKRE
jgi:N-acylglucosamine 2-epimerase